MTSTQWPWITDNTTFVNPVGIVAILVLSLLLVFVPKRYALVPFLVLTCFMTMGQRVMLFGLNFTMLRILIAVGCARVILHREVRALRLCGIDYVVVLWSVIGVVAHTLLWRNFEAVTYRLGQSYNALGMYFLFRLYVRDWTDIGRLLRTMGCLTVPLAGLMIIEKLTGENPFALLGGVPPISEVRDGIVRCQGPFGHSILAGTFAATLIPLFLGMIGGRADPLVWASLASTSIITLIAGSSGPVLACAFGILGFLLWPLRKHMRKVRYLLAAVVVCLHLLMKAPVWFLVARINVYSSSTGYHRAMLIDEAISRFSEWWLFGTRSTAEWGYGLVDITNQYIRQGVEGGVFTMALFIAIIALAFRDVGRALRQNTDRTVQFCIWGMGASLLVHTVSFLSVSYFDQNFVNWYMLLALIATVVALPARQLVSNPLRLPVPVRRDSLTACF
jgi:hypothetical protein